MSRPTILFVQPSLQPPGGGNAVAVCALDALKDDFDVTVLVWRGVEFDEIARDYGVRLGPADFQIRKTGRAWPLLVRLTHSRAALLQRYVLSRHARRIAHEFDAVVSFNNEIDAGEVPTVQYIHYPAGIWPRPSIELRLIHRVPGLLRAYYKLSNALAPVDRSRIARNITLVNSDWTAAHYRACYGGEATTVYPPLMGSAAQQPWEERENVVVALGVFAPHKRLERVVDIVEQVRRAGNPLRLWIVGTEDRHHPGYARLVRALPADRPWIELKENLSRAAVDDLLGRARYGLHAMEDEHFGMAVAEMVAAGCIPFVPAAGGQVEVVREPELLYDGTGDAVARILRVTADEPLQRRLRASLRESASRFEPALFRERVRRAVAAAVTSARSPRVP